MNDIDRAERVLNTIVGTVPQWFSASAGKNFHILVAKGARKVFYSTRRLTRSLSDLLGFAQKNAEAWCDELPLVVTRSSLSRIGEEMAVYWLGKHGNFAWRELLAYFDDVRYRTSENAAVALNLIIRDGAVGSFDIRQDGLQRILDSMAASPNTFVRVCPQLKFIDFGEIHWSEIASRRDYKFNPEFLQPIKSTLGPKDVSAHITTQGDVVFMNSTGLIASFRKGSWYIYQADTMKNALVDVFGPYRVGCNMFELALDLSYRRHGGLLVYDPAHAVFDAVVNDDSKLSGLGDVTPSDRQLLCAAVRAMRMGNSESFATVKRRLVELASIDGAVIFDEKEVLAIGAMIKPHRQVKSHFGARTTATYSALHWGGRPMKVSADGDILIPFWHTHRDIREIANFHYL